jgi:polar amino acid transport system substrate-binding protein
MLAGTMRVLFRALFISVVALTCSCGQRELSGLERVRQSGYLRWGGDLQGGEPYVFEDPSRPGGITGFEVEIAAAVARELGVRPRFVQQDWSALVPSLERGSFDVALNGLEVTPARAASVAMTRPYFIFSAQLVARKNDPHTRRLADLRGRRVGTLASSFSYDILREAGNMTIVPYEGNEEPYADLAQGRLDGVLLDDVIVARYGTVRTDLHVVQDVREGYYAAACRERDRDLCDAIDAALGRIAARGELRQILRRWEIDNDRQTRLAGWTDQDTHAMLLVHDTTTFGWHHVVTFLQGALVTLLVSTASMSLAIPLGLLLALARMYGARPLSIAATAYVELFRGTPVLLQLYLLYFGVMPWFRHVAGLTAGSSFDAFIAAILGLGMNYAAYEAEIYRSGIQAIPPGQMEAARVLGMGTTLALRRIIVPQAVRIALPGVTNDFIALLKDSSLVSVITVVELTKHMTITAVDVRSWALPGALCAALYMAMSYPLSRLSQRLEERLAGGSK